MVSTEFPNLFILGPPRCGSTSLYNYLITSEDIDGGMSKEPKVYIKNHLQDQTKAKLKLKYYDTFKDFYSVGISRYRLDATPGYLQYLDLGVLDQILRNSPNAKFIVLIRNGEERAKSLYKYMSGRGYETEKFSDAISLEFAKRHEGFNYMYSYVNGGIISSKLEYLLDVVGCKNVFLVTVEELSKNHNVTLDKIASWLNIDSFECHELQYNSSRSINNSLIKTIVSRKYRLTSIIYDKLLYLMPRWMVEKMYRFISRENTKDIDLPKRAKKILNEDQHKVVDIRHKYEI